MLEHDVNKPPSQKRFSNLKPFLKIFNPRPWQKHLNPKSRSPTQMSISRAESSAPAPGSCPKSATCNMQTYTQNLWVDSVEPLPDNRTLCMVQDWGRSTPKFGLGPYVELLALIWGGSGWGSRLQTPMVFPSWRLGQSDPHPDFGWEVRPDLGWGRSSLRKVRGFWWLSAVAAVKIINCDSGDSSQHQFVAEK